MMYAHNTPYLIASPEADVVGTYHRYASEISKVPVFVVTEILRADPGVKISVGEAITPGPKASVREIKAWGGDSR